MSCGTTHSSPHSTAASTVGLTCLARRAGARARGDAVVLDIDEVDLPVERLAHRDPLHVALVHRLQRLAQHDRRVLLRELREVNSKRRGHTSDEKRFRSHTKYQEEARHVRRPDE
jgi:hypothetical protein